MTELVRRARDLAPASAVVMTMGALHEGHASLIRAARARAGSGRVTVTVFVNPLQFGPNEDLDRYPRTLDADLELAKRSGADTVFAPPVDEMYPGGQPQVRITAGPMGEGYEGASRPGHFDGMLTVVAKLLHLTLPRTPSGPGAPPALPGGEPLPGQEPLPFHEPRPGQEPSHDRRAAGPSALPASFYGQKDAQQLALIRRMVTDLDFPVEIVAVPTVREDDGLALSSRNRYLSPQGRTHALALSRALFAGRDAAGAGPDAVRKAAREVLAAADGLAVDYLALVDPADFTEAAPGHTGSAVLAVAAKVAGTRLIDNIPLEFGAAE